MPTDYYMYLRISKEIVHQCFLILEVLIVLRNKKIIASVKVTLKLPEY